MERGIGDRAEPKAAGRTAAIGRDRARATKDIDLVLHHCESDLARALELACLPLRMHIAQKLHGMILPRAPANETSDSRTWSTSY